MRFGTRVMMLLLLAGCQTPIAPRPTTEQGTRTTHVLREEPHRAAVCIARNLDRRSGGLVAHIRQGTEPALVEVHLRGEEIVAIAQLLVNGEASTAVIWVAPDARYPRAELVSEMIAGC